MERQLIKWVRTGRNWEPPEDSIWFGRIRIVKRGENEYQFRANVNGAWMTVETSLYPIQINKAIEWWSALNGITIS